MSQVFGNRSTVPERQDAQAGGPPASMRKPRCQLLKFAPKFARQTFRWEYVQRIRVEQFVLPWSKVRAQCIDSI